MFRLQVSNTQNCKAHHDSITYKPAWGEKSVVVKMKVKAFGCQRLPNQFHFHIFHKTDSLQIKKIPQRKSTVKSNWHICHTWDQMFELDKGHYSQPNFFFIWNALHLKQASLAELRTNKAFDLKTLLKGP